MGEAISFNKRPLCYIPHIQLFRFIALVVMFDNKLHSRHVPVRDWMFPVANTLGDFILPRRSRWEQSSSSYCTANVGNFYRPFGTTHRSHLEDCCPETSVRNYHYLLRNTPEEPSSLADILILLKFAVRACAVTTRWRTAPPLWLAESLT